MMHERKRWIEQRPAPDPLPPLPGYDPLSVLAERGAAAHPVYDVVKGLRMLQVQQGLYEAATKHGGELKNGAAVKVELGARGLEKLIPYERARKVDVAISAGQNHDARVAEINAVLAGVVLDEG